MFRKLWSLVVVLALMALSAAPAQSAPGDRLRARVQESQQRMDQADARIRQIVRDIASSGSPQATTELNAQLKTQEKERSAAQIALYQAREQLQALQQQEAQLKADIGAFIAACKQFEDDTQVLRPELEAHNRDAAAQREAVNHYNALPASQRGQAEADRLNRWRDEVNARRDRLDSRRNTLERRRGELLQWENDFKRRAQQFENS